MSLAARRPGPAAGSFEERPDRWGWGVSESGSLLPSPSPPWVVVPGPESRDWLGPGCVWLCVAVCGRVWLCVVMCGHVWLCVIVCVPVWLCVGVCGRVWLCVAVYVPV